MDYDTYEMRLRAPMTRQDPVPKEVTLRFPSLDQLAGAIKALSHTRGMTYQIWRVNLKSRIRSGPVDPREILREVEEAYRRVLAGGQP